jgi:hypothetical protein
MEDRASYITVARRVTPWFLVNYILLPLCAFLILAGYGKSEADAFWSLLND